MNVTALAVIVDSAVTLGVGYWLNRTAKREVKSAVNDIGPAIQAELANVANKYSSEAKQEIAKAIQKLVPVLLEAMKRAPRPTTIRHKQPFPDIESIRASWERHRPDIDRESEPRSE